MKRHSRKQPAPTVPELKRTLRNISDNIKEICKARICMQCLTELTLLFETKAM